MYGVFRSGSKKQAFDIVAKARMIHQSGGVYYSGSIHLLQHCCKQSYHRGNVVSSSTQCSQLHYGCKSCASTRQEPFQELLEFFGHFGNLTEVTREEI